MRAFTIGCCMLCAAWARGQEQHISLGASWLYAPAWDRMVRTFNFARPFLDADQPLLQWGVGAGCARFFKGDRRIRSGVALEYGRFISQAEATGLESRIRLHQLRIGYAARILPKDRESPWQVEAGAGLFGLHLSRLVNDAPIADEEQRSRSLGIGADLRVLLGRRIRWGEARWIVPFISAHVAPYVHQPTAEAVLNQTRGLVAGDGTFMLLAHVGVRLAFGTKPAATP
ncbi:MAG: hypothetical protein ACK4L7_06550 [Flavobacteriales bacterium]